LGKWLIIQSLKLFVIVIYKILWAYLVMK
jgi:hypothetical protein